MISATCSPTLNPSPQGGGVERLSFFSPPFDGEGAGVG